MRGNESDTKVAVVQPGRQGPRLLGDRGQWMFMAGPGGWAPGSYSGWAVEFSWSIPGVRGWEVGETKALVLAVLVMFGGAGHPGRKLTDPSSGAQVQKPPGRTARAAYRTCALSTCSFHGLFNAAQGIRTPFASPVGEQQWWVGLTRPTYVGALRQGGSRERRLRPAVACGSRRSSEPGAEWPYTR